MTRWTSSFQPTYVQSRLQDNVPRNVAELSYTSMLPHSMAQRQQVRGLGLPHHVMRLGEVEHLEGVRVRGGGL